MKMKTIQESIIVIISVCLVLLTGAEYAYPQKSKFIIRLENGMEIKTDNILIEEGVLYYQFSSQGKRKVGIATSSIARILERNRSGELKRIEIPPQSKTVVRGELAEKAYFDKNKNLDNPPAEEKKKN